MILRKAIQTAKKNDFGLLWDRIAQREDFNTLHIDEVMELAITYGSETWWKNLFERDDFPISDFSLIEVVSSKQPNTYEDFVFSKSFQKFTQLQMFAFVKTVQSRII